MIERIRLTKTALFARGQRKGWSAWGNKAEVAA
jgi:N6-adenosine-specific RNA methylase IME4